MAIKGYQKRNCQQMEGSNMICLLLEKNKKKYLEIILDDSGCNKIIEKLSQLNSREILKLDLLNQEDYITKQGYQNIELLSFVYCSEEHIANTGYNIKCSIIGSNEVEVCVTLDGIQELQSIMEYIKDNDDHFHLFGGFDLYTGNDDNYALNNLLGAVTIYNVLNY